MIKKSMFGNLFRKKASEKQEILPVSETAAKASRYQVANLQGIGTREKQEDSFGWVNALDVEKMEELGLFAVVTDGMGGLTNGKIISEKVVMSFKDEFSNLDRKRDLNRQLKEIAVRINQKIFSEFRETGGTTAIACMLYRERLYYVSVGDSVLLLKRGNQLIQINHAQSYKQSLLKDMVHGEVWDLETVVENPEAECIVEYIGKEKLGEPDGFVYPLELQNGDRILICTDGVTRTIPNQTILESMEEENPMLALEVLEKHILRKNNLHQDNYTALLISCNY